MGEEWAELVDAAQVVVAAAAGPIGNFKDTGVNLSVPLEWIDPEPLKPEWLLFVRSETDGESIK